MPKQITHSQLKKWIGNNQHLLATAVGWKQISKIFQANDLEVSACEYYRAMFPEKVINCEHAKFVSLSVGYRTCRKGCKCYVDRVAAAVKAAKSTHTAEDRARALAKRKQTVKEQYGVENVSHIPGTVAKIKNTKATKYGDPGYNNRDQAAATLFEKAGVVNPMQLTTVVEKVNANKDHFEIAAKTRSTKIRKYGNATYNNPEKRAQSCIQKYGVNNPAKSRVIKEKISQHLREKFISQHRIRYNIIPGFVWSDYAPGQKNVWYCATCGRKISGTVDSGKFSRCLTCFPRSVSKPELELREFVAGLGFEVLTNERSIIAPYELDIVVPEKKVAIEFCGTYWHSEQQGKGKFYHRDKLLQCHAVGYTLITIFSDTWEQCPELVKSRLMSVLGCLPTRLDARACVIRPVSAKEADQFLEKTHTQGSTRAAVRLGLFLGSALVALMTLGKSRFEKNTQELIRFSTLPGYCIRGAASKLFCYYSKQYSPCRVVSYSDNNWGLTEFYRKLGFVRESIGTPGYSYINLGSSSRIRLNRINFQKHKIVKKFNITDTSKTEYEIMLENNFDRVWDTGHSRWVWTNSKLDNC